ncbi:DAK2 domain-containing protein [Corynebacterium senegalense]|uniref:DAK2 domain-containing protein n=1 Tax=Corynebacterium senegalense TaxID=2080750 RepID=UPI000E1FD671|nr:DAK2 domain-containing protein [Corynebacterium senegalense]
MVTAAEPAVFDGARLMSWARRSTAELERRRMEINELNVFPVRDSDTGSNMAHTMRAAVAEAERLGEGAGAREVAEALAVGSMRGARGNSGVVLSQVIRAVAQNVGGGEIDGSVVSAALDSAVHFVDRAISEPVEGTVVTVLRAAALAAAEQPGDAELADVSRAALSAARTALARTPSQLEVLREAGVVDAGGTGLVILLEELVKEIAGDDAAPEDVAAAEEPHSQLANLEVMFLFDGPLDALEAELSRMGTSLVIAHAGETEGKVHIHSLDAGRVIETAFAMGRVTDLRLEVLPATPVTENPGRLIVAVTPAGSLAALYGEAGAVTAAPGPDVVSGVLAEIRRSPAGEVILLPNGQLDNRQLGAVEKAARAFKQTVTVLPTVRLVSGIAALTVHDPDQPLSTVSYAMSEAAGEMRTAAVQRAEKAGLVQGGAVSRGDFILVAHGETSRAPENAGEAVAYACRRLLEHGGEQVSILYAPEEFTRFETAPLVEQLGVDVLAYPADGLGAVAEIGVE